MKTFTGFHLYCKVHIAAVLFRLQTKSQLVLHPNIYILTLTFLETTLKESQNATVFLISYFIYIASVKIKILSKRLAPKQTTVFGNLEEDQAHMPIHASYM